RAAAVGNQVLVGGILAGDPGEGDLLGVVTNQILDGQHVQGPGRSRQSGSGGGFPEGPWTVSGSVGCRRRTSGGRCRPAGPGGPGWRFPESAGRTAGGRYGRR